MSQKVRGKNGGEFNGFRSWNAWNVSLHLSNDPAIYRHVDDLVRRHGIGKAATILFDDIGGQKTLDGAVFNRSSIRGALRGWT